MSPTFLIFRETLQSYLEHVLGDQSLALGQVGDGRDAVGGNLLKGKSEDSSNGRLREKLSHLSGLSKHGTGHGDTGKVDSVLVKSSGAAAGSVLNGKALSVLDVRRAERFVVGLLVSTSTSSVASDRGDPQVAGSSVKHELEGTLGERTD